METETGRQRKPGTDRDKQTHIQTKAKNDGCRQRQGDRQRLIDTDRKTETDRLRDRERQTHTEREPTDIEIVMGRERESERNKVGGGEKDRDRLGQKGKDKDRRMEKETQRDADTDGYRSTGEIQRQR